MTLKSRSWALGTPVGIGDDGIGGVGGGRGLYVWTGTLSPGTIRILHVGSACHF